MQFKSDEKCKEFIQEIGEEQAVDNDNDVVRLRQIYKRLG